MKKWKILNRIRNNDIIECLLQNRGLKTEKEVEEFLHPTLEKVTIDAVGMEKKEITKAIRRIKKAIEQMESMIVYTDYDVDGICAGAIVWEVLHSLGARAMPYVPHRVEEGYGLSKKGIDQVKKEYGATLIITVDHGITARDNVVYAKSQGIDVIVTDHHLKPKELPDAIAIVHTTQLSGSGVAWMLAREVQSSKFKVQSANETLINRQLELVALATIADLVPLVGSNRTLTKFGLEELNKTSRVGLLALIEGSGLPLGSMTTYEVGHILAPRINALGRIAHAIDALRLLCTRDRKRAQTLAQVLATTNKERQLLTEQTILHAQTLFEKKTGVGKKLIFLYHESFNQGIIGLVAGKLVEKYYLPAIVLARGEIHSKASARSIAGFNIVAAIRQCSDILVDSGGHPMAAGFTVETAKLDLLQERLEAIAQKELTEDLLKRTLAIDCEVNLADISFDLITAIERLRPFGMGNPQPTFATRRVTLEDARLIGADGRHVKLRLVGAGDLDVIGFGMGEFYSKLSPDQPIDIAYTIDRNTWNGSTRLQLKLRDLIIPSV